MNTVRFGLAVAATWLLFVFGSTFWHEALFGALYDEWIPVSIERLEMPIMYFLITHIMRALVFVYGWNTLDQRPEIRFSDGNSDRPYSYQLLR